VDHEKQGGALDVARGIGSHMSDESKAITQAAANALARKSIFLSTREREILQATIDAIADAAGRPAPKAAKKGKR
jgi:hypothetical protein